MSNFSSNKCFILIELLVAVAIIIILTAAVSIDFKTREKNLTLQRNAYKITQDIRKAREMTMSGQETVCDDGTTISDSYGVHLNIDWDYYILFAECGTNEQFDGGDKIVEKIYLEEGIEITDLGPPSDLSIFFEPPDPITFIKNSSSGETVIIEISCIDDVSLIESIIVNNAGLIEVQ